MGKKFLTYSFGLIALYIGVNQYTGAGSLMTNGANAGGTLIQRFQGR